MSEQGYVVVREVNRVARLLMAEWERVEHPVTPSYVATFADLARVVVADRAAPVTAPAGSEDAGLVLGTEEREAELAAHEGRQGSREARNGRVSAGDGRGHGRDDESGRGADSQ